MISSCTTVNTQELEARFKHAVHLHQQGSIEEASLIYLELLDDVAESPLVNFNLGLALFELEHYEESCRHYRVALEHAPKQIDILYNLALCYRKLGELEKSASTYREALTVCPDDSDCLYNLACCYAAMGDAEEAIAGYQKTLEAAPEHHGALSNLAYMFHRQEEYQHASALYRRLLAIDPDHHAARHMLDALQGERRTTVPVPYILEIFDNYSDTYDQSLQVNLEYGAPQAMRKLIDETLDLPLETAHALDIGCGTGLSGMAFASLCHRLEGVDLSRRMIEKAREKNIYDALTIAEIEPFIGNCRERYSLVIAADVVGYIGGLEGLFAKLRHITLPHAVFCFSSEYLHRGAYSLQKSGRFAHTPEYMQSICDKTGWRFIQEKAINLRREKGEWVAGNIYIARRR